MVKTAMFHLAPVPASPGLPYRADLKNKVVFKNLSRPAPVSPTIFGMTMLPKTPFIFNSDCECRTSSKEETHTVSFLLVWAFMLI